jgi:hypothetical protein
MMSSPPQCKFMVGDLKDFYLGTPMMLYKYMRVPVHMVPQEIIELYKLAPSFTTVSSIAKSIVACTGSPKPGGLPTTS